MLLKERKTYFILRQTLGNLVTKIVGQNNWNKFSDESSQTKIGF